MKRLIIIPLAAMGILAGLGLVAAQNDDKRTPEECRDLFSETGSMPQQTPYVDGDTWRFDSEGDGFYQCGRAP